MTDSRYRDRRSLSPGGEPSGVLVGHTEGITYVSPKGDGRYVISNGKDQTLKLWDLRKMSSNSDFLDIQRDYYGIDSFDYRLVIPPECLICADHRTVVKSIPNLNSNATPTTAL